MIETHYDGIRRVTKDTDISNKTERITISKSYLELYKEKGRIHNNIALLKNYYIKLINSNPKYLVDFQENVDKYIKVIKAVVKVYYENNFADCKENFGFRVEKIFKPSYTYFEHNKKYTESPLVKDGFNLIVTCGLVEEDEVTTRFSQSTSLRIYIDRYNMYKTLIGRGTYSAGAGDFKRSQSIEQYSCDLEGIPTLEKDGYVPRSTTVISLDFLLFMLELEKTSQDPDFLDDPQMIASIYRVYYYSERKRFLISDIPLGCGLNFSELIYKQIIKAKNSDSGKYTLSSGKGFATKLTTKKNRPKQVQEMMENSLFKGDGNFEFVEYDEDINKANIKQAEFEFKALVDLGIIPKITDLYTSPYTLRVRKLGREKATGMLVPSFNLLIIDKTFSFIHEFGHLIDYSRGTQYSESQEFSSILTKYSNFLLNQYDSMVEELHKEYNEETDIKWRSLGNQLSYFLEPTEVFARSFEHYMASKGLKSILLGTMEQNLTPKWMKGDLGSIAYTAFSDLDLNEEIITYFDNMNIFNTKTPDSIQEFNNIANKNMSTYRNNMDLDSIILERLKEENISLEEYKENEKNTRKLANILDLDGITQLIINLDDCYDSGDPDIIAEKAGITNNGEVFFFSPILNRDKKLQGIKRIFLEDGVRDQMEIDRLVKKVYKYLHS